MTAVSNVEELLVKKFSQPNEEMAKNAELLVSTLWIALDNFKGFK